LYGLLVLPAAAAGAHPLIETELMTVDLGKLAAVDIAEPQGQAAGAPAPLSRIDQLYLNRQLVRNLEDSNAALRNLLAGQPGNPDLLWRLGRGMHAVGARESGRDAKLKAFQEGESLLTSALAQRPNDGVVHYWLGRIYGAQNEIKRTLGLAKAMRREFEAAIRIDPNLAGAHHYLGVLLYNLPGIVGGDKHKAVAELQEAVRLAPNEASHYSALAEAYLEVKDKNRAIESARNAVATTPSDDPGGYDDSANAARELLKKLGAN
jgi:tetratricopeptide (TPR) repeat protein